MNENNKKLIINYYKLLKISIPCLIMSILTGVIWLILETIDGMALANTKSSATYKPGIYIFLGLVAINLFMFAYSTLKVRFGLSGKKWKEIISELSNIDTNVEGYNKEVISAVGTVAVGKIISNAENKTVANIGKGVQAVGAIQTINVANKQIGSMKAQVLQVAEQCNIKLPSMKKWIALIIIFPFFVLSIAYIPRFIESNKNRQEEIAKIQNIEKQISSYLETYFERIKVDNPEENIQDYYNITGYMENDKEEYIYIDITPEGIIKKVNFHSKINENESKEENIRAFNNFIKESNELLEKASNSYSTSITQVPEEAIKEYMETNEKFFTSGKINNFEYSFHYNIDSYDNQPYLYFTIENNL